MIKEITKCRICGNTNFVSVINLGVQTLSGTFPKLGEEDPPSAPLELIRCDTSTDLNACGLVQLRHSITQDNLYKCGYGYLSGINQTMRDHLKDITHEAQGLVILEPNDIILDIGSNDGTLLKQYNVSNKISLVGIDAGGEQYQKYYPDTITLISDYFTGTTFKKSFGTRTAKIITSIAMFYDLECPQEFMKDIKDVLHPEGIWIIEQSYYPEMLTINSFDTICHEHLEYYSLSQISRMAEDTGLRIVDVDFNNSNGGSFRVILCHQDATRPSNTRRISKCLTREINNGHSDEIKFRGCVYTIKRRLIDFLAKEKSKGKTICIYGASTKGNVLLQYFGIDNTLITAAADKNPAKWGCMTPGTHIPILSEEEVRQLNPDYFLVLPWHFREEFLARESEYRKQGGKLIFPLPFFEVVE